MNIKRLKVSKILFLVIFSLQLQAQVLKLSDTISCEPLPLFLQLPLQDVCDVLVTNPVCNSIKKEYQIDCKKMSSFQTEWSYEDFKIECTDAGKAALTSFGKTLWDITKYSILLRYDPITQTTAGIKAKMALDEAKLLFDVEYELAKSDLAEAQKPLSLMNILRRMSVNIWDVIYPEFKKIIEKKISHYTCLNTQGKSELICSMITEIFVPPFGVFAILKYGSKADEFVKALKETIMKFSDFGLSPERIFPLSTSQVRTTPLKKLKSRPNSTLEHKLNTQKIIDKQPNPDKGFGESYIITLEDGTKGIWKPHQYVWHQNYRAEVLAYELDQKFGFGIVPPTVERSIDGKNGSFQAHVDTMASSGTDNYRKYITFQYLILNSDYEYLKKNNGVFSVDHGAGFTNFSNRGLADQGDINKVKNYMTSAEGKELATKLSESLTPEFEAELAEYLGRREAKKTIIRIKRLIKMAE